MYENPGNNSNNGKMAIENNRFIKYKPISIFNQLRTDFFLTRGSPVAGIIFDKKTLYIHGGFC